MNVNKCDVFYHSETIKLYETIIFTYTCILHSKLLLRFCRTKCPLFQCITKECFLVLRYSFSSFHKDDCTLHIYSL